MILTIRTDKPESEIGLYKDGRELANETWRAHRQLAETIHSKIDNLLTGQNLKLGDIDGIVVFKGPGSFTGLRIGVSVANSLAYGLNVPIIGVNGTDWQQNGIKVLKSGKNSKQTVPEYGGEVFTTKPKK